MNRSIVAVLVELPTCDAPSVTLAELLPTAPLVAPVTAPKVSVVVLLPPGLAGMITTSGRLAGVVPVTVIAPPSQPWSNITVTEKFPAGSVNGTGKLLDAELAVSGRAIAPTQPLWAEVITLKSFSPKAEMPGL